MMPAYDRFCLLPGKVNEAPPWVTSNAEADGLASDRPLGPLGRRPICRGAERSTSGGGTGAAGADAEADDFVSAARRARLATRRARRDACASVRSPSGG